MSNKDVPSEIIDNFLYLGNWIHASQILKTKDHPKWNITHILTVGTEGFLPPNPKVQWLRLRMSDYGKTDLTDEFLDKCCRFIDEAKEKKECVLVHCAVGVNRSPTLVIAYLMKSKKWTLQQAYSYVKKKRPQISPNQLYRDKLMELEKRLFGKNSMDEF